MPSPVFFFFKVTNLGMFSISFTGFLYQVEFSTRSHLCHRSSSEGGPRHLPELLHKYTPFRQLRSSSDSFTLRVPTTNIKTFGESYFSFTDPTVWNSLPFDIRSINFTPSFRQALKTRIFKSYFVPS